MRSALGANRSRIVVQMFAEALVLGVVAAAVGLVAADVALRAWAWRFEVNLGRLPFWFDLRCRRRRCCSPSGSPCSARIAGVVPASRSRAASGRAWRRQQRRGRRAVRRRVDGGHRRAGRGRPSRSGRSSAGAAGVGSRPDLRRGVRRRGVSRGAARVGRADRREWRRRCGPHEHRAEFGATLEGVAPARRGRPGVAAARWSDRLPRETSTEAIIGLSYDGGVTGRRPHRSTDSPETVPQRHRSPPSIPRTSTRSALPLSPAEPSRPPTSLPV